MTHISLERLDSAFSLHWDLHPAALQDAPPKWARATTPPKSPPAAGGSRPAPQRAAAPQPAAPKEAPRPAALRPTPACPEVAVVLQMRALATRDPGSQHREAGLRLPALGHERHLLGEIENRILPALARAHLAPDEAAGAAVLVSCRDPLIELLLANDFTALREALDQLAGVATTPTLAAVVRTLRLEMLLWVRRRRAAGGAALAAKPASRRALEDLEHQLVGQLVRPL